MICPTCGSENREGAKFCDECGAQLEAEDVQPPNDEKENSNTVDGFDFSPIGEKRSGNLETDNSSEAGTQGIDTMVDDIHHQEEQPWGSVAGNTAKMPRVEGKSADEKKEFRAPDAAQKKQTSKGKKAAISVLAALVILVGGFGLTLVIDLPNGTNIADALGYGKLFGGTKVPDVTGLNKDEATQVLEERGFSVRATHIKSDEDNDVVLLMDPEQGSRNPEGETIVLHVAIARSVPDIVGKSLEQAQKALEEEGLTNIKIKQKKSNKKEGTVLSVKPDKGEKLTAVTEVTLKVAEAYKVPEVAGMGRDAAVEALKAAGYEVHVVSAYSEEVEENLAVYTEPQPGEKLNSGETVTLGIAKSRASELKEAADQFLESTGTITLDNGTTYQVSSVEAVEYVGDNVTVCTIVAAASTVLDGEVVTGSYKTRTVSISWSTDNHVVSIT